MTFFYHHKSKYGYNKQTSVASEAKDDHLTVDEASQIQINVNTLLSNDTTGYTTTNSSQGHWYWSKWSCWNKGKTTKEYDDVEVLSVQDASHGSVSLENGIVTFTPDDGYSGPAVFTYTISDGKGGTDQATVNLNIVDVNQAPVAIDDAVVGEAGAPIVIDPVTLLANDGDPDGDAISIVSLQNPQNGTVDFVNGAIVFTPDEGYTGPAQFEYSISDNVPSDTLTYYTDAHGRIGTLDLETGDRDVIVDTPKVFHDIAMGEDGQLFAMEHGNTLYGVDKDSGELTYIGKTSCDNINGLVAGNEGKLYGVSDSKIYEIDQETAKATVLDIPKLGSAGDVVYTDGQLYITTDKDQLVSYDLETQETDVIINNLPDCKSYGISLTAEGLIAGVTSTDEIYYVDLDKGEVVLTGIETDGAAVYGLASAQTKVAATATVNIDVQESNAPDGIVDGTSASDDIALGYTDVQGDVVTDDADTIVGGAGDDTINGEGGGDVIYGDSPVTDEGSKEVSLGAESGEYNLLVWDLADLNISGTKDYPFQDHDVTGEPTHEVAGGALSISTDSKPVAVGVNDNDAYFNDGDLSQKLANDETINGVSDQAGDRFTPEYAYTIKDTDSGEVITIYAVELGANKMVGIVSDKPLTVGADYEFVARVDKHPSIKYDDLADTYFADGAGDAESPTDGEGGDDAITGGEGADTMYGQGGDDTFVIDKASDADGDVVVGGNGPDLAQDNDTLDLRGAGEVKIDAQADDTDYGAQKGTVTFEDGSTLTFSQIETIIQDDPNQSPDAVDDTLNTSGVGVITIDPATLLANDSDPDGDALQGISVQDAENGVVEFDGTNIIFTPDVGYQGPATFTYTISDGQAEDTATVTLQVNGIVKPDTPDGAPDLLATSDTGVSDSDDLTSDQTPTFAIDNPEGLTPALYIDGVKVPSQYDPFNKTLTPAGEAPDGVYDVSYTLTGPNGVESDLSPALPVEIDTTAPETPYGAPDMTPETDTGVSNTDDVTADTTPGFEIEAPGENTPTLYINGSPVESTFDPVNNTLTLDVALPDGTYEVRYTLTDPAGNESQPSPSLPFVIDTNPNQTPDALDDVISDTPVGAITIDPATLLANDSDPDGDAISGVSVQDAVNGTVAFDGGNIVFTPTEGYVGDASFTYTITDGNGAEDTATVSLQVNGTVQPGTPESAPDMTPETDTGISDSDDLTSDTTPSFAVAVPEGLLPQLYIDGEKVLANYDAAEGTLTPFEPLGEGDHEVTYSLIDNGVESAPSPALPIEIDTIAPDAADAAPDMTPETDTGLSDSDDYTADTTPSFEIGDIGENTPTLYIDGEEVPAVYEPVNETLTPVYPIAEGQHEVTYTLTDPAGNESAASPALPIEINTTPENQNPDAVDDGYEPQTVGALTFHTGVLLANDTDADGDALTVVSVQDAEFGTVTLENGEITFMPMDGYQGPAAFTYTVEDGKGGSDTASVNLLVDGREVILAPDYAPDMTPETDTGVSDSDDLTSDTTPDFAIQDPGEYTAVLYVNGQEVPSTYDADKGVLSPDYALPNGELVITYSLRNDQGQESPQSEALDIVVNNQDYTELTPADMTPDSDTGVSDSDDVTKDTKPAFEIDAPEGMTPVLFINGSPVDSTFDPQTNQLTPVDDLPDGTHEISYQLKDDAGNTTPVSEPLTVVIDTTAPETGDIALTAESDTGDSDSDGITDDTTPTFSIDPVADAQPTLYINGSPVAAAFDPVNFTLTPEAPLPEGDYEISYTLTDLAGNTSQPSDPVAVQITTFVAENTAPEANDDVITDFVEGVVTIDPATLLANDTDADGDPLQGVSVQDAENGTVSYENGNILFTPTEGYVGPASFTYTVSDGQGGSDTATVTIEKVDGSNNGGNDDDNLIYNGSFENTTGMDEESYGYSAADGQIPGWTDKDGYLIDVHNDGRAGLNATDGNNWLDLGGIHSNNHVMQTIQGVKEGEYYELSFDVGDAQMDADGTSADNTVTVIWGGEVIATIDPADGVMERYTYTVEGGAGDGGNRLEFKGGGEIDNVGVSIDKVRLVSADADVTPDTPVDDTPDADTTNPQPGALHFNDYEPGENNLPPAGWYTDNNGGYIQVHPQQFFRVSEDPANQVLELERYSDDAGNFYTYVASENGSTVELSFDYSARPSVTDGEDSAINILIDGEVYQTINTQEVGFAHFEFEIPGTGEPMRIEFKSVDSNARGGLLDNIYLSEDPLYPDGLPTGTSELPEEPPIVEDPAPEEPPVADEPETPVLNNAAPDAQDDAMEGTRDNAIVIDPAILLANDLDADGDALRGVSVQDAINGTVEFDGINVIFTPDEGYIGEASFTYTVTDGNGGYDSATVNLTVAPEVASEPPVLVEEPPTHENSAPEAYDDTIEGERTGVIEINPSTLIANDLDADGDKLTGLSVENAVNGTVEFDGETILFTPFDGYQGPASFTYNVSDDKGAIDTATVNLTISSDNSVGSPDKGMVEVVSFDDLSIGVDVETPSGWFTDNDGGYIEVNPSSVYGIPGEVTNVIELERYSEDQGNFYTYVNAAKGETIDLSFDYSARLGVENNEGSAIHLVVDGEIYDTVDANAVGFTNFQYKIEATGEPMRIEFQCVSNDSCGGVLDNIQLSSQPIYHEFIDFNKTLGGVDSKPPSGWYTDNADGLIEVHPSDVYGIHGEVTNVLELDRYAEDVGNFYTYVNSEEGKNVTLAFDYSARQGEDTGEASAIHIMVNGEVFDTINTNEVAFTNYTYSIPGTGEQMRIEFQTVENNSGGGLIDNIYLGQAEPIATNSDVSDIVEITGTSQGDVFSGTESDETFEAGIGDDLIAGGKGSDTLIGGVGADTFSWSLSDTTSEGPSIDIITDFGNGDDVIDLKDLLVGESNDAETLSNYLHFETDGDKTTVHISAEGKFAHDAGGELDTNSVAENTTQIIQLDGIDLTSGGSSSDLQVIQNLISNNQLITD